MRHVVEIREMRRLWLGLGAMGLGSAYGLGTAITIFSDGTERAHKVVTEASHRRLLRQLHSQYEAIIVHRETTT